MAEHQADDALTDREIEVLRLVAAGNSNKIVADHLAIPEETVKGHVECQRANWKLGGPRGAAARLGLKRTTLFYKMKRLGITPPADHSQD